MHTRIARVVLGSLIALPPSAIAGGPEFWLGAGGGCDFQSVAVAIGAAPNGSIIRIASNQTYENINVVINNRALTLVGGYADCTGTPGANPTFVGAAGANAPVFRITSAVNPREVTLQRMRIEGGTRSGIEVSGRVDVELRGVVIDANLAAFGGGLKVSGLGTALTRVQLISTLIGNFNEEAFSGNQASSSGGGVACVNARVTFNGAALVNNSAEEFGGGLDAGNCLIDTGFQEFNTAQVAGIGALFQRNRAAIGGGIAAYSATKLNLGPITGLIAIRDNEADIGGGIRLTGAGTRLEGAGVSIDDNRALARGGGVALETGGGLFLRRAPLPNSVAAEDDVVSGGPSLAFACLETVECNTLRGNRTEGTTSSAVHSLSGVLQLANTAITDNDAGVNNASTFTLSDTVTRIENSLLAGNVANGELFRILAGTNLAINASTIAGNTIDDDIIKTFSGVAANNVVLFNSIIWQPGNTVLADTDIDTSQSTCVNAHEDTSIGAVIHDPGFVDAAGGNYRLHASSSNIDACDDSFFGATVVDILGQSRPADLGDANGIHDRGAYELPDRIFTSDMGKPPPF